MNHTKGTWMAKEGQIYPEETGKTLALIPYFDKDDKEQEANAKLIAAAPEMLEALIEISKGAGRYNEDRLIHASNTIEDMQQLANDAIQKATE